MTDENADPRLPIRGRGSNKNPPNRFSPREVRLDESPDRVQTEFFEDSTKSIISFNDSPDLPFCASLNPYRGCEHGCAYCYARPTHEFLDLSAGLDFETRVFVKSRAEELLETQLTSRRWQPQLLALSGVTDPYQPIERERGITRRCLEVLVRFRNPVGIITKNEMVTRDADLLAELASFDASRVFMSITTLDEELAGKLEPRCSRPQRRLQAIRDLTAAGVPCGVMLAPIIPGLNDHEIPRILESAAAAGADCAGYILLRLPGAVEGLFTDWLQQHYPNHEGKVLHRLAAMRGGKLQDGRFGHRMRGTGAVADEIRSLFEIARRKHGLGSSMTGLSSAAFRRPGDSGRLFV